MMPKRSWRAHSVDAAEWASDIGQILDPGQASLDPGVLVTGELRRFGYDAQAGQVVVQYDGSLSTAGGSQVQTRRFTATAPADGTAASVGPALNRAANQVALEVAQWSGG